MKVGIIYNTNRREATYKIVAWLESALGQNKFEVVVGKMGEFQDFDCDAFIVGSAVYGFHVEKKFEKYLGGKKDYFKNKPLATFVVCGLTKLSKMYRRGILKKLPSEPISHTVFKGYYNPSDINTWDIKGQKSKVIEWVDELTKKFFSVPIGNSDKKLKVTNHV